MRIPCVDGHPERRGCGLENRKGASPRGFESLSLRQPAGQPAAERSSTSEAAWQAQVVRLAGVFKFDYRVAYMLPILAMIGLSVWMFKRRTA